METVLLILFIIVCLLLTLVIILQPAKTGGMGSIGGSASGGALGPGSGVFGSRGAVPFLAKMTVYLGIGFAVLVLVLARFGKDTTRVGADDADVVPGMRLDASSLGLEDTPSQGGAEIKVEPAAAEEAPEVEAEPAAVEEAPAEAEEAPEAEEAEQDSEPEAEDAPADEE